MYTTRRTFIQHGEGSYGLGTALGCVSISDPIGTITIYAPDDSGEVGDGYGTSYSDAYYKPSDHSNRDRHGSGT